MKTEVLVPASANVAPNPDNEELLNFLIANGATRIQEHEGGLIDCYVPTELIDYEEVPVKEEWANELGVQMREIAEEDGGWGQQQAIGLGLIDGEPMLKIIDGFHRNAALRANGAEFVRGTVKLTDWNKLYDQRIFDAKNHTHVRFSRVVQWIREVWEYSGLADKMTVQQAIILYQFESSGKKLHVTPEEAEAAKEWVKRKEHAWGINAMTIRSHLNVAENVDPQLVHSTREKNNPDVLAAPTQAILHVFSKNLPKKFDFQNLVMEKAMEHNLTGPQVRTLCVDLKGCEDAQAAKQVLDAIDWTAKQATYEETTDRALRRAHDPRYKGAAALENATNDITRVTRRTLQTIEREEEVLPEMIGLLKQARRRAEGLIQDLGGLVTNLTGLIGDEETRPSPAIGQTIELPPEETQVAKQDGDNREGYKALLAYLMGQTEEPPLFDYKAEALQKVWVQIENHPNLPKDFRTRFQRVQPAIAMARHEQRLDRRP